MRKNRIHHSGSSNVLRHEKFNYISTRSQVPDIFSKKPDVFFKEPTDEASPFDITGIPNKSNFLTRYKNHKPTPRVVLPLPKTAQESFRSALAPDRTHYKATQREEFLPVELPLYTLEDRKLFDKLQLNTTKSYSTGLTDPSAEPPFKKFVANILEKSNLKEKIIEEKLQTHSLAEQETQLVGLTQNLETLEGKVNLEKLKEIRRAIRRRYAYRSNIQKIFSLWDTEGKGFISLKNILVMCNQRLGIKINADECQVLVASVSQTGAVNELYLNEFLELVFSDKEEVFNNIDLRKIPKLTPEQIEELEKGSSSEEFLNYISQKVDQNNKEKHETRLHLVFQKKLTDLVKRFNSSDLQNKGVVTRQKLFEIFERLDINSSIFKVEDMQSIFEKFKASENNFDYRKFIEDVKNFELDVEKLKREKKLQEQQEVLAVHGELIQSDDAATAGLLNYEEVPVNSLHKFVETSLKMSRTLVRYYPTKKDMDNFLSDALKLPTDSDIDNELVSYSDLREAISRFFSNVAEGFTQQNYQEFFSLLCYNKNTQKLHVKDFKKLVYDELDYSDVIKRIQSQPRNPPPTYSQSEANLVPNSLIAAEESYNRSIAVPSSSMHSYGRVDARHLHNIVASESAGEEESEKKGFEGKMNKSFSQQNNFGFEATPVHAESANFFPTNTKFGSYKSWTTHQHSDIRQVLQKIDDCVFFGKKQYLNVFRSFDTDADSYISTTDLLEKIKDIHLLTGKEQKVLLEYLDPGKKGFVNFQEFHSKIYANVANSKEATGFAECNTTNPSRQIHENKLRSLPSIVKTRKMFSEPFDNSNTKLTRTTKFGCSPPFKNTLKSFCPGKNTAFYCSEAERFDKSPNFRTAYQEVDKLAKQRSQQERAKFIQTYNQWFEEKVLHERQVREDTARNALERKGKELFLYEHVKPFPIFHFIGKKQ